VGCVSYIDIWPTNKYTDRELQYLITETGLWQIGNRTVFVTLRASRMWAYLWRGRRNLHKEELHNLYYSPKIKFYWANQIKKPVTVAARSEA
jgi:hypothetical protein